MKLGEFIKMGDFLNANIIYHYGRIENGGTQLYYGRKALIPSSLYKKIVIGFTVENAREVCILVD